MLPGSQRLRLQQDFDTLRRLGTRYHQPALSLVTAPDAAQRSLAGFIVSKKISPRAVQRNRVKRRLRAAYHLLQPTPSSGQLLLFIARPALQTLSYQALLNQMQTLLKKARVLS